MGWTEPRTYTAGQVMTVALMNEISDNLKVLKGSVGTVPIDAGITASGVVTGTDGLVAGGPVSGFVAGTPVSGDAGITVSGIVTAQAGMVPAVVSGNGSLTASGSVAAGAGVVTVGHISGLGNLTISGYIYARTGIIVPTHISAEGNIDTQRNGIRRETDEAIDPYMHAVYDDSSGTHGLLCFNNASAYAIMAYADYGSYVGNGSGAKVVYQGAGGIPKLVLIQSTASGYHTGFLIPLKLPMWCRSATEFTLSWPKVATYSSFYVGSENGDDTAVRTLNASGQTYYWVAVA